MRALKVRHNNVLGYFVEVTAQHGEKLLAAPLNTTFIHRQTLAGQVRFTTTELARWRPGSRARPTARSASSSRYSTGLRADHAAAEPIKHAADALCVLDVAAALGSSRSSATMCAEVSGRSIS